MEVVLESGAAVDRKTRQGGAPLHDSTLMNHCTTSILDNFILSNAQLDVQDVNGWTPLHWVVHCGNFEKRGAFMMRQPILTSKVT